MSSFITVSIYNLEKHLPLFDVIFALSIIFHRAIHLIASFTRLEKE